MALPPAVQASRPRGGAEAAVARGQPSVLRYPTLPCAKDTSGSSAGRFYAAAAPLYDPLPRSDRVSWRQASSWQGLPPELGKVTKAEEEVARPGWWEVVEMSKGPARVTVTLEAAPW